MSWEKRPVAKLKKMGISSGVTMSGENWTHFHDDVLDDILLRREVGAVAVRRQNPQLDGLHAHQLGTTPAELKT